MTIQAGTFLSLTSSTRNYATNTLKSDEEGINFLNQLGGTKLLAVNKQEEAWVNTAENGHLAVVS